MQATAGKELYSSFGFFQAVDPSVRSGALGQFAGNTIDMQGYEEVLLVMNIGSYASSGADAATNAWKFVLQHASTSILVTAAGAPDVWSVVPESRLIHSVLGGYGSTAETGVFFSMQSKADILLSALGISGTGNVIVGYKMDTTHRFIRIYCSVLSLPSAMWLAGTFVLGNPSNWPVNATV